MEITVETKDGKTLIRTSVHELLLQSFMAGGSCSPVLDLCNDNFIVKADGIIQERPEYFDNDE